MSEVVTDSDQSSEQPKRENIFLNLALNVIIPSLLMSKGKAWSGKLLGEELSPAVILIIALAFPVAYGIYDFVVRRKYNFFSIIGFISILISGGIGLMNIDKGWVAVKEAAVPLLFGLATLVSLKTPFPLVRTLLYNPEIFDVPKVEAALKQKKTERKFEKLMVTGTMYLVASFILSAVLNYGLAKYCIRTELDGTDIQQVKVGELTESGKLNHEEEPYNEDDEVYYESASLIELTGEAKEKREDEQYNEDLGFMTLLSWPVIVVPTLIVTMIAFFKLISGIKEYTGYEAEEILRIPMPEEPKDVQNEDEFGDDDELAVVDGDSGNVTNKDAESE